jgi:hypothetical protein
VADEEFSTLLVGHVGGALEVLLGGAPGANSIKIDAGSSA